MKKAKTKTKTKAKTPAKTQTTVVDSHAANSLDEIRAQCAAVREGLLDGSMSHNVGLSVSKAVIAEAKMMQEVRKITELRLKHSPDGAVSVDLLS